MNVFTYWERVDDAQGRRFHCSTERLVERFRIPVVTHRKEALPGWSPTTFRRDYRLKANVQSACAVGFDIDGDGTDLETVADILGDLAGFIYTSYRHTAERQRARAILWTSREVAAAEYPACWLWGARRLPTVGEAAKDSSRLWFVPGIPPGGEYRLVELTGAPLDVDAVVASVDTTDDAPEPAPFEPIKATTPIIVRAQLYLATCDVAVSGQHGHTTTFLVAQKLVRGFRLDEATAYALLTHWNQRCQPPWSEKALRRKIKQAAEAGRMEPGKLLNAERAA